jgi:hypothetical protein
VDNDVRPPQRTDFPHVGAALAHFKRAPGGLPGHIAIPELAVRSSTSGQYKRARPRLRGGGAGFLGPRFDPLAVNGDPGTPEAIPALRKATEVDGQRLERRAALLSILDQRGRTGAHGELRRQAVALTGAASGTSPAFSLAGEPTRLLDRYGRHRFGRALLLARRLAEAEVPMIAIHFNEMTVCDGWDTHSKNFDALRGELLPMVDQGLSALIEDLGQRGLLEQTLVVMMGEFGRTPRINRDAGRDHWGLCQSVLFAGGGTRGGIVYGTSDRIGAYPMSPPIDPTDVHATIYHCMGVSPDTIVYDHLRRPVPLCTGRPIAHLL